VDAVAGSGIRSDVLGRLTAAAAEAGVRVLLVRRPGRLVLDAARGWLLAGLDGGTLSGPWAVDDDLLAAAAAMTEPVPATGTREPIILVCTHGIHDTCCAIRGRPVAAALSEVWPDQVWECSHVGGDRFAPNVVVLPDGYYYGNVDPDRCVGTVRAHLAGAVAADNLRGMSRYPPAVQAAVVAAHQRLGPCAPADIVVRGVQSSGAQSGHGSITEVDLAVPGQRNFRARVLAIRRAPARLTCRADHDTPATEYQVQVLDS
jgi:(2Fe-2S) ferredoxin